MMDLSLNNIKLGLKNKDFSVREVVEFALKRISQHEEGIQAYITILPELAIKKATDLDKIIASRGDLAFEEFPLLGVPYAVKDNFCTKDIKTTAGSKVLKEFISPYESTVTEKLNSSGAILVGKTNLDAFAHGSSTETSDFFVTKNPWDQSRVPGGSSGGSAAAVSADFCAFAIGSETGGSIRGPASWCGVTGLKPTYGRVSRYGIVAMASSTDSPGPITKSALDSAKILQVIAGKDLKDATTSPSKPENYVEELAMTWDVKGLRVGRPRQYFDPEIQPQVKEKVNDFLKFLEKAGAEIIDVDLMPPKYSIAVYTILQRAEVSSNLARFDGIRYGNDRTFFGFEAKKRIMLGTYTLSAGYYDAYYLKAQKSRTLIIDDFDRAFKKVDVLIGPTMPCTALKIGESGKNPMFGEMMDALMEPSTIAGLCGITIPVGFYQGLPVGAQIIGNKFQESLILKLAHWYQQNSSFHLERPKL